MPEIPPLPGNTDHHRARERAYQAWAADFDRQRREIEREGVSPEEAGYRLLAQIGEFRFDVRSAIEP